MGLFTENKTEARKVVICPKEEGTRVHIPFESPRAGERKINQALKDKLKGEIVKEGQELDLDVGSLYESKREFDETFGFRIPPLKILKTRPQGEVRLSRNTIVKFLNYIPDEQGLPKSRIVRVKDYPNLKELIGLKTLKDLKKLMKSVKLVKKFKDDNKIIYFVGDYFYQEDLGEPEVKKDTSKEKILEAERIVIEPVGARHLYENEEDNPIKNSFRGEVVWEGKQVKLEKLQEDFEGDLGDMYSKVLETEPAGRVRVSEDTKIEIRQTNDILDDSKIIEVKDVPDLDKFFELRSLNDLEKLSKNYLIHKAEREGERIFFADKNFYKEKINRVEK